MNTTTVRRILASVFLMVLPVAFYPFVLALAKPDVSWWISWLISIPFGAMFLIGFSKKYTEVIPPERRLLILICWLLVTTFFGATFAPSWYGIGI